MQLDDVRLKITERRPWEAVDLGFTMTRAWAGPLYRVWLAVFLPFATLIIAACYALPWLGVLIVWWLKPLFDRVPLYFLSRAVFGEIITPRQIWQALPQIWGRDFFRTITVERLNMVRALTLPVSVLEGLRGAPRRARLKVIMGNARNTAMGLTVGCMHIEQALVLAALGLLYLFVPPQYDIDLSVFFTLQALELLTWTINIFYIAAVAFVEPFYVAGGFGLYLNRRIILEGWDIELTFRRMAQTLPPRRAAPILSAILMVSMAGAGDLQAAPTAPAVTPQRAQQVAKEVLSAPEFKTFRETTAWRFKNSPDLSGPSFSVGPWLAETLRALTWLAFAIVILLILRALWRRGFFRRWKPLQRSASPPATPTLQPLDEPEMPLPTDIAAAARAALHRGEQLTALSLLYRGALHYLARQATLSVGATEEEWLRVSATQQPARRTYLDTLITAWRAAAYAHRLPPEAHILFLCDEFTAKLAEPTA